MDRIWGSGNPGNPGNPGMEPLKKNIVFYKQTNPTMSERLGPKKFSGLKWVDIDPFGLYSIIVMITFQDAMS